MGEVYRSRDVRLGRDVAIKIVSPRIAADADAVARFEREARALAALNHPNIAAIYDVIEHGQQPALVLELVEGDTLADRLAARPLSIAEALHVARQLTDALDTAHEAGIVHRDLKPANITITEAGQVKILDFGLAKAIAVAAGQDPEFDPATTPTITVHGTAQGVILGTAAYMSPEQARGKRIDKRTDIWAFGCVLFEMLAGKRAFDGETTSDVIAAIIERAPDLSRLPPATPAHVRRVISRCLEKDPKRRARDIAEVRIALDDAAIASPVAASGARRLRPIAFMAAGLAAGFLLALATRGTPPRAPSPIVRSSLFLPEGVRLSRASVLPVRMANDGSAIAYIGEREGANRLYVQRLDQAEPTLMPGTEGATQPFFSPDARWIGYFADDALQKIAADGQSAPLRLAQVDGRTMGATWGPGDTIVWAVRGGGLRAMGAAGGTPKPIAGVQYALYPEWLPDGRSIIFTTGRDNSDIRAFATIGVEGGSPKVVAQLTDSTLSGPPVLGTGGNLLQAQFVAPGYLVFGQSPGAVRALPVDPQSFSATGPPIPLADNIERGAGSGGMYFAASRNGRLVSAPTGERHQLVWVDRSGRESLVSNDRMAYRAPRISPDGKVIAVAANDDTRRSDIWLYDAARGTGSRLTTSGHNLAPLWTNDGSAIVAASAGIVKLPLAGGRTVIFSREQRGSMPTGTDAYPTSWIRPGRPSSCRRTRMTSGESRHPARRSPSSPGTWTTMRQCCHPVGSGLLTSRESRAARRCTCGVTPNSISR